MDEPFEAAKTKALSSLRYGFFSAWEMEQRLQQRYQVPPELARRVCQWMVERVRKG